MTIRIFTVLFIIFGLVETLANIYYLAVGNGVALARKQHREMPAAVSDRRMRRKMLTMLGIGVLFLGAGAYACIAPVAAVPVMLGVLALFTVYMFAEAIYYRQAIGFVFGALGAVLLLSLYLFV